MPKFIVCDPSISSVGGHYLVYAQQVMRAAQAEGFEPILVTNRAFKPSDSFPWSVHPVFEFNIWGRAPAEDQPVPAAFTKDDRRFLRLKYSRLGLLWCVANHLQAFQHYNSLYPVDGRVFRRLKQVVQIRAISEAIETTDRLRTDPSKTASLPKGPERRRDDFQKIIGNIRKASEVLQNRDGAFTSVNSKSYSELTPVAKQANVYLDLLGRADAWSTSFARCFSAAVVDLGLDARDHLFFPSMSMTELKGLNDVLRHSNSAQKPTYHLLFRRDAYSGYSDSYDQQEWQVHGFRTAFALMDDVRRRARISVYTDTDELTAQYRRFDGPPISTAPVPVDVEALDRVAVETASERSPVSAQGEDGVGQRPVEIAVLQVAQKQFGQTASEALNRRNQEIGGKVRGRFFPIVMQSGTRESKSVSADRSVTGVAANFDLAVVLDNDQDPPWAMRTTFVGTIEAGVPAVVPGGTWFADALDAHSLEYHRAAFHKAKLLVHLSTQAANIPWRLYQHVGKDGEHPGISETSAIHVEQVAHTYFQIDISSEASHLWLTFDVHMLAATQQKATMEVRIGMKSADDSCELSRIVTSFRHSNSARRSVAFALPDDARSIWVGIRSIEPGTTFALGDFEARLLSAKGTVAPGFGGIPFRLTRRFTEVVDGALQSSIELLDALPAYRESLGVLQKGYQRADAGNRRVTLTFLGDARDEKGFHRLPALIASLARDRRTDLFARFAVQVYAPPSISPDPRMLLAIELVKRHSKRLGQNFVQIQEGPLDVDSYNKMLLSSDVVLVPYFRSSYTSRSSGIFTEALVAGKPVLIPAGTWMSAYLHRRAFDYHLAAVPPQAIRKRQKLASEHWIEYVPTGLPRDPGKVASPDGLVSVLRDSTTVQNIQIPSEASHVWFTFRPKMRYGDQCIRCVVAFLDGYAGGSEVSRTDEVFNGVVDGTYSMIVPVDRNAKSIWFGLTNSYTHCDFEVFDVTVAFIESALPIVRTPGGRIYIEEGSDSDVERAMIDASIDLVANYQVYAQSSRTLETEAREYFTPQKLVRLLLDAPDRKIKSSEATRFSATEW